MNYDAHLIQKNKELPDQGNKGISPPAASRSILSIERGPNVVRITSATACQTYGKIKQTNV